MRDRLGGVFVSHPQRCGGFERCFAAQHFEQDDTQRINITARIHIIALGLLGTHIRGRADDPGSGQLGGCMRQFGDAKIRDECVVEFIEKDIARFQVTVDDILGMGMIERGADALDDM